MTTNHQPITADSPAHPSYFARQPLSLLAKIAFWAFALDAILGGVGALLITLGTGAPSRDTIIATACSVVGALLMLASLRWTPWLAALVGAYNFYLIFTEPFAIESIANPKGPNGGYGHFVGDIIVDAVTLVALGASLAAAIQSARHGGRQAPRWLPQAATLVIGLVIGALYIGALSQPAAVASSGTTFTNGVPTVHMNAGNFTQSSVTIPAGDKLLLVDDSSATHILANGSWENNRARPAREAGAPLVNKVEVSGDSVQIGPFTTKGTYYIYCLVHPGMTLTVNVQ